MPNPQPLPPPYTVSRGSPDELRIRLQKCLDVGNAALTLEHLHDTLGDGSFTRVTLDLSELTYLDEFGALVILQLREDVENQGHRFEHLHLDQRFDSLLKAAEGQKARTPQQAPPKSMADFFVRLGQATTGEFFNIRDMLSFVGSVLLALLHVCRHPKSLRVGDTILLMERTGANALPIVGLISFLLGLIMAFMSSIQLQQFGANIYVASLVALAMVSELGPIMTAIVVAGRSGSAFAAEIGSMRISEEIDALFTMGFNPTLFLAVPRIIAAIIVVPLLTLYSDVFAITGGLVVGVFMLDLTPGAYITQTFETITLFEILWGAMKSCIFAVLVAWTGCLRGFQVRGGADAVGNAATSAVVSSIFLIILFDSIFAVIRSYW